MERLRPESSRSGLGLDRPVAWAHGAQTRPGGGGRGGAGALDAPLGRDGGALALCRLLVGLEAAVPRDRGGRAARRLQRRVAAGRVGAQHLQSRGDAARWSAPARPPQPWSESGTVPPLPPERLAPFASPQSEKPHGPAFATRLPRPWIARARWRSRPPAGRQRRKRWMGWVWDGMCRGLPCAGCVRAFISRYSLRVEPIGCALLSASMAVRSFISFARSAESLGAATIWQHTQMAGIGGAGLSHGAC
jgi:hypothetical protein